MTERDLVVGSVRTVTLESVRVYSQVTVDAYLMDRIRSGKDYGMGWKLLEEEDAYAKRMILSAFGRRKTYEVTCPATWWDHLKQRLRARWPRLFGRLRVAMSGVTIDTGAVVADLPEQVRSAHVVIPYTTDPCPRGFVDNAKETE